MRFSIWISLGVMATLSSAVPVPCQAPESAGGSLTPSAPRVKQGSNADKRCPSGWQPSLVDIDLCVEIGSGASGDSGKNAPKPPNHPHSSPKQSDKPKKKPSYKPQPKQEPTEQTHPHDHDAPEPTCPSGQVSSKSAVGICVDVDLDPFTLHGGVKIGHGPVVPNEQSHAHGSAVTQTQLPACRPNDPLRLLHLCIDINASIGAPHQGEPAYPLALGGDVKNGNNAHGPAKSTPKASTPSSLAPCSSDGALLGFCVNVALPDASVRGDAHTADPTFKTGLGIKIGAGAKPASVAASSDAGHNPKPQQGGGTSSKHKYFPPWADSFLDCG